jgi:hypothetical protein
MVERAPIHPDWSCTMPLSPADPDHLRPANPDDVAESISHALRYDGGRKRVHHADSMMARVTADPLVRHLLARGYVIMKRGGAVAPTTSNMPTPYRP